MIDDDYFIHEVEKDRGECLGYSSEKCNNCGRVRIETWENGDKICEKCNFNQTTKEYEFRPYI